MRSLDGITNSMDMSVSKLQEFNDAQGSLASCGPWDHKELDMIEQLNWTESLLVCSGSGMGKECL